VRNKAFFLVGYQATKARGTPGETNLRTFTAAEREATSPRGQRR